MTRLLFLFHFALASFLSLAQTTPGNFYIKSASVISCTPVKDQYMSSTCWSFASNSFIESELLRMGEKEVDLSEMYTARLIYPQKIIAHLQQKGQNYFTPGGQFHDVQWVIKHYGMVPEEVYNGKPRGEFNHDHSILDTLMKRYVDKMVADGKTKPDEADWRYINNLLDRYLGKLPAVFTYEEKPYTPQGFLKNELGLNPDDYLEITSYSHHPWYTSFVLENKYNWSSGLYMNVPLNDFIRITDEALDNGYSVLWDGDADDMGFVFREGLAFLPDTIKNLGAERQRTFADSSSYLDHMMHIVGKTTDNKGHKWYYIKNSWGSYSNSQGGYLYMDENYFAIKTAAIVVNKQIIPADIRNKMKL